MSPEPSISCASSDCSSPAAYRVGDCSYCRKHFIPACYAFLDRHAPRRLAANQSQDAPAITPHDLARISSQILDLTLGMAPVSNLEKAQLLDLTLLVTEILHKLRRSPRTAAAIPVRISHGSPGTAWTEDTVTQVISQNGALLLTRHTFTAGDRITVIHPDSGREAAARVACIRRRPDGAYDLGVEFLNSPNFWSSES